MTSWDALTEQIVDLISNTCAVPATRVCCRKKELILSPHLSHAAFFLQIFANSRPHLTFREDAAARHLLKVLIGAKLPQDALHDPHRLRLEERGHHHAVS